jgi:hypothetical protein
VSKRAVEQALADLDAMRVARAAPAADLDGRQQALAMLIERLAVAAEDGRVALERRLRDRIARSRWSCPSIRR